jgi:hypothetical protein
MQAHGQGLSDAIAHAMGILKAKALVALFGPMLLLIQMFAADAVQLLNKPLLKLLHVFLCSEVRLRTVGSATFRCCHPGSCAEAVVLKNPVHMLKPSLFVQPQGNTVYQ